MVEIQGLVLGLGTTKYYLEWYQLHRLYSVHYKCGKKNKQNPQVPLPGILCLLFKIHTDTLAFCVEFSHNNPVAQVLPPNTTPEKTDPFDFLVDHYYVSTVYTHSPTWAIVIHLLCLTPHDFVIPRYFSVDSLETCKEVADWKINMSLLAYKKAWL